MNTLFFTTTGGDSENAPHERNGSGKLARYQLRPMYIAGLTGARSVACGEAHTLCVMDNGELYAWGQVNGRNKANP